MPSSGTALALLDRETRAFHAETDRGWHRLLRDDGVMRDEHVHQLTVTYGIESPLELACSHTNHVDRQFADRLLR